MKYWIALASMAALSGCASLPEVPQSRAEWQAVHSREFSEFSEEQVLEAVEKVLRLADDDFKFDYPDGRLVATRNWMTYAVIVISGGTDYWTITTKQTAAGVMATVEITRASGSTGPAPVFNGGGISGATVTSSSTPGQPMQFPAPYKLFWSRVEYTLTGQGSWQTCAQFKSENTLRERLGFDVLCSVNTDDKAP